MNAGVFTDAAADTLLGYAYMQPGVRKVELSIDVDQKNDGKNASVTYTVKLSFWKGVRHDVARSLANRGGIFSKLLALGFISVFRAPRPGQLEARVANLAKLYLPENYRVIVNVE